MIENTQFPPVAIVGMDINLSSCQGLEAFERSIYDGTQNFISPEVYIQDRDNLPILLEAADKLSPEALLMLQVSNNALRDAALDQQTKVAVVIVTPSAVSLNHNTDKLASYISRLWNTSSPAFALSAEKNSVFQALNLARKLLTNKQVDAVLVGAVDFSGGGDNPLKINTGVNTLSFDQRVDGVVVGGGAAAVVLKLHDAAQQDQQRIYAVIASLVFMENSPLCSVAVTTACEDAFKLAGIQPGDIGYLEAFASGIPQQDAAEIQGLLQAYQTGEPRLSCGIGSIKANIGHTFAASGLVSLVKTALCLYYRYIPVVPQWSTPKMPEAWGPSPFYIPLGSKPWLLEAKTQRRIAAINSMDADGSYAHLILLEEMSPKNYTGRYLEQMPFYLFAIAGHDQSTLLEQLHLLAENLQSSTSLATLASLNFTAFQQHSKATYALAILGRTQDELNREIQRAIQGVPDAFNTGLPWKTPIGSYFTPQPLGESGKVAFVYPGSFSAYIGLARHIFRLFPQIIDHPIIEKIYTRLTDVEKLIYPRSLQKLSSRQLEALEEELVDNAVTMLELEIGFSGIMSAILQDYFQIQPQCAFGYSVGEISMIASQGIWSSFKDSSDYLNSSPLFKTQLSGPKYTVRQHWELPQEQEFWSNYVLICSPSQVREALKNENQVYLCLINTPEEVVIAGETQACQRVIKALNCDAFSANINHVIHCQPVRSHYDELVKINTLPIENRPETVFYTAAKQAPMEMESQSIGINIAQGLCQEMDFPKLINRVYDDGYNIFVEVGIGSNCSRWIDATLKQKEHVTVSVNKRGVDDHTSIVRSLAKLVSHRVNLDLSPLYSIGRENGSKITQLPNSYDVHLQKLSHNSAQITKTHGILLQARRQFLQRMSTMIQMQLSFGQGTFR